MFNMATPAQERLGKLFAKTPLPPKPDLPIPVSQQVEAEKQASVRKTDTLSEPMDNTSKMSDKRSQQHTIGGDISNGSGDDDDYIASLKGSKAEVRIQREAKSKTNATSDARVEHEGSHVPIRYLPEGKSSTRAKKANTVSLWKDENYHDNPGQEIVGQFCPFSLVTKFPYKYMQDGYDRVSKHFFAGGKIYLRTWDLYYLHLPESFGAGPMILVPADQVKQLLAEISEAFKVEVTTPQFPFVMPFYDDATPQPVLLGTSHNREEMNDIKSTIPDPAPNHGECPANASVELRSSFEKWHEKCLKVQQANKKTKSGSKKNGGFQASFPEKCDQLKRAQRYFGLRPRVKYADEIQGLTWDQREDLIQEQLNHQLTIKFLDDGEVAPYEFDGQPIIISIDVESYERNHSLITEVGVSTLDTMDLVDVTPGKGGVQWTKLIRSRHFLINGRESLVNHDFVHGCPESFHFGVSERIDLDRIADEVDSCFEWPFSVQYKHDGKFIPELTHSETQSNEGTPVHETILSLQKGPKDRNLIILGHDIDGDITYLSNLGSGIFGKSELTSNTPVQINCHRVLASILESLDTASLFQAMTSESQPRSLGFICKYLDIDAWHLHNAGNDARYTLESLVKLVIKSRQIQDEATKQLDPGSTVCIEKRWESERTRLADETMTRVHRELRDEIKALEEARGRGNASPKLLSSTFRGSLPVLIKQSIKPPQTAFDHDEAIRLWTAAQTQGDSTWA